MQRAPTPYSPQKRVTGFGFTADTYDPTAKLFAYDTGTNHAQHSGEVSAYGYTAPTPEPVTLVLLACGGLVGFAVRRKRDE